MLLRDNVFAYIFGVFVIEFGDLTKDPEYLSVHLLVEVTLKHIREFVFLAQSDHRNQIAKGAVVILGALIRVLDESINSLFEFQFGFWELIKEPSEKSHKVDESSNGKD